jgi:hypothetical protein
MARGNRCSTVNDDAMGWYCFTEGGLDIVIILSHVGHLLPMFLLSSVLRVFGIRALFTFLVDLPKDIATS